MISKFGVTKYQSLKIEQQKKESRLKHYVVIVLDGKEMERKMF